MTRDYPNAMQPKHKHLSLAKRFRGFYPVVVDVETSGIHPQTDAILEIAAISLSLDENGLLFPHAVFFDHITPFEGANIDPKALEINKIDPYHPFRFAKTEHRTLKSLFTWIKQAVKEHQCQRAILVGHNAHFDLSFIQAAALRCNLKSPFHRFSVFDTVSLGGVCLGETILAKAVRAAGFSFDPKQAHSALYDAERTAELFCYIVNNWYL